MDANRGFSLIETIVVVGIMGVLAVAGVASYNKMNDRARVEQAAQLLATELRTLQKRADAGVSTCSPGVQFGGVRVTYTTTVVSYCDMCAGLCGPSKQYELLNGVSLVGGGQFEFGTLSQGANSDVSMMVRKGKIGYSIVINRAGGISVAKAEEE